MTIPSGTNLGPYEIQDLLGAGGMGEVYRARDPRLSREVAVKLITTDGASSPERLHRFETEARAAAQLAHPNVVTVFDVGTHEGHPYLVLELLDGQNLRETLRAGTPPLRQSLTWALETARGLGAAHERGIIHRDLKPENIFLTEAGRVKVLDFGLAKLQETLVGSSSDTSSPTATKDTSPGVILGTIGYMSPEQVKGEPAVARSDVFALGAVLYELLAGQRAFTGATAAEILASILRDEPPSLMTLRPEIPASVETVVRRCLGKHPTERFSSGNEVAVALETVLSSLEPSRATGSRPIEPRGPYPGLSSFTEADAERFYGRESEVESLWEKLRQRPLLALIGPSGAGKTSFVRAGLLPSRPTGWGAIVATPGAAPMRALAQALVGALPSGPDTVRELLAFDDPEVALRVMKRWRQSHLECLVVVDQFEELFTLNPSEEQSAFAEFLGRLAKEGDMHVLLSLRDDFLIRCHEHEPLAQVFQNLTPLLSLGGEDLRRALVEPAKREEFDFEDESLVEEMLQSVEGARGALPLLAFAVARLWEKRDREKKLLTRKAYEQVGGVAGALAQHAEQTLERIGLEREPIVRELFRNLVTAQWTRAVADREQLLSVVPDRDSATQVLDELIAARLLTSYEVEGRHRIEIVHESLIRAWPRLVRWQAQDEEGAVLRDQLKQAARLWEEKSRSPDVLWTGTAFQEFELWRDRYKGQLTALEDEYARAMLDRVRRNRRLRRAALATIVVASLGVAAVVSVLGHRESQARARAEAETLRAEASKLVALGRLELDVEPTASLAYARKSLETHDNPEARRLALEALWRGPTARVMRVPKPVACNQLTASPDGTWLACGTFANPVGLFSHDGTTTRVVGGMGAKTSMMQVLFSRDSRRLATYARRDAETIVWSVEGEELARLEPAGVPFRFEGVDLLLALFPTPTTGWQFDARTLGSTTRTTLLRWPKGPARILLDVDLDSGRVFYSAGPSLFVRNLEDGAEAGGDREFGAHPAPVINAKTQTPSGDIVSIDADRGIRVWSGRTLELKVARQGLDAGQMFDLPALDRTGTRLAWDSQREGAVVLWDLDGPPEAAPLLMRRKGAQAFGGNAVFLGDGHWLAKAAQDTVAFWPVQMPWPRILQGGGIGIDQVAFTLDSSSLVSCSRQPGKTGVWPLTPGSGRWRSFEWTRPYICYGIAVDAGGEDVLVAAPAVGGLSVPLDGSTARALVEVPPTESIKGAALSPDGHWAAVASPYAPKPEERRLHVVDRRTGEVRAYQLPGATADMPSTGGVKDLRFVGQDRLLSGGFGGVRLWNVTDGESESLRSAGQCRVDASASEALVLMACAPEDPGEFTLNMPPGDLALLDLETKESRAITAHGSDLQAVALDAAGQAIATGDSTGVVRVGRADGSEPHLLLGANGMVTSIAFSPDGRWVASAIAGGEIRLWPMPDLDKPPFHTLPPDVLLAKLDTLTNLRVVVDDIAPTGYRVDIGPFPGWQDVPEW